ncbi:VanZ family protein [Paenibacillus daejeonensis]|uniref:VanZ family protein n=1 Tax=Paenibacillus daejeonensis TaxID=135193 RepID=UPI0003603E0D|nr:VanZ family protein [Paenibacillus daejeonensis]
MRFQDVTGIARDYLFGGMIIAVLGILVVGAGYFVVYKWVLRGKRTLSYGKLGLGLVSFLYLFVVMGAVLLNRHPGVESVQLQPFHSYRLAWHYWSVKEWRNVILNILMFVPIGFLLPLWSARLRRFWLAGLLAFGFSLLIELTQLLTGRGVLETDDLIGNTVGGLIGYGLGMLVIHLFQRKRLSMGKVVGYLTPVLITIGAFGGIFVAYATQELGNLGSAYVISYNTDEVTIASEVEMSSELAEVPIYAVHVGSKQDTRSLAEGLFQRIGAKLDEAEIDIYYDSALYYSEGRAQSVWVDFQGMNYRYIHFTPITDEAVAAVDADEAQVREALMKMGIELPLEMIFEALDDSRYLFTADMLPVGGYIWHGDFQVDYHTDGVIKRIMNDVLLLRPYRTGEIISEAEAYEQLSAGRFVSWRRTFDSLTITEVNLDYEMDTKGYVQPIYRFHVLFDDEETVINIPALK